VVGEVAEEYEARLAEEQLASERLAAEKEAAEREHAERAAAMEEEADLEIEELKTRCGWWRQSGLKILWGSI
jgi:hypothetical protein